MCFFSLEHGQRKPTLPMYLLQSLQRHLSVTLKFVFSWKISSDLVFLITQGTISPILGTREDILSVPKCFFVFMELNRFCTKWETSVAKIYRFLSWNSIVHSPTMRYPKERAIRKPRCYESILENTLVSSCSCNCILLQELGTFYVLSL